MYAIAAIDRLEMVKIEQGERMARAHRFRMLVGPEDGSPRPPSLEPVWKGRHSAAAAVATLVSLATLAAAALG
jgi:hypothetical protein